MKIIKSLLVGIFAWLLVLLMGLLVNSVSVEPANEMFGVIGFFTFCIVTIVHYDS
jgi:hypothetical protein